MRPPASAHSRYMYTAGRRLLATRSTIRTRCAKKGSVANFDFQGEIRKLGIRNSMSCRVQNSRKNKFATDPFALLRQRVLPTASVRRVAHPQGTERVIDPRVAQGALNADGLELALAIEEAGHPQH